MTLKDVSTDTFAREVLESQVPVVVDFHAEWCGPCHSVAPVLAALSQQWEGRVRFTRVDVDENPRLATAYRVSTIPAILLFEEGEVRGWSLGAKPGHIIERELGLLKRKEGDEVERSGLLSRLRARWKTT